ncbi:MAG: hypothetical protein AAGU19_22105 [Prolixibacteraceae bacterium]
MNETDCTELSDEVKLLAMDLLSNETLVIKQTSGSTGQEVLFYGRAEIWGDMVTIVNDGSSAIARLCSSLLAASAVNRQASWTFICKALS